MKALPLFAILLPASLAPMATHAQTASTGSGHAYPTALLSGEVTIGFLTPVNALAPIKAGRFRALAVTSLKRLQILPEVPTMIEAGVRDFESIQWFAALAPAGTPRDIITRLNAEIAKALNSPDMRDRAAAEGAELVGNSPEALAAFLDAEIVKWARVIRVSGAKAE